MPYDLSFRCQESDEKTTNARELLCELRKLFALMVASERKYVDPSRAVEIMRRAFVDKKSSSAAAVTSDSANNNASSNSNGGAKNGNSGMMEGHYSREDEKSLVSARLSATTRMEARLAKPSLGNWSRQTKP